MSNPVILLVGHCGPDSYALRSAVSRAATDAEVMFVNDDAALNEHLPRASLLLVNRVLEMGFESSSGTDLIARIRESGGPACMLISNYADAQAAAEEVGALPGFGKSAMYSDQAAERIRTALTASTPDL